MDGPEISPETFETNIKTKESEIYRIRVADQINRVCIAGSKDLSDHINRRDYERSIKVLEIIMVPVHQHKPWVKTDKDKNLDYGEILEKLEKSDNDIDRWDHRAMALISEVPKLGFMPPKTKTDEDLGDSQDFRDFLKFKKRRRKRKK